MQIDLHAAIEKGDGLFMRSAEGGGERPMGAEDGSAGFAVAGDFEEISKSEIRIGGGLDAGAVRRVCDDEGRLDQGFEVMDVGVLKMEREVGFFLRRFAERDGLSVAVAAKNRVRF